MRFHLLRKAAKFEGAPSCWKTMSAYVSTEYQKIKNQLPMNVFVRFVIFAL